VPVLCSRHPAHSTIVYAKTRFEVCSLTAVVGPATATALSEQSDKFHAGGAAWDPGGAEWRTQPSLRGCDGETPEHVWVMRQQDPRT